MDRHALYVAVAASVLLAGCSLLGPDHTRDERAVETLENATDSIESVDSYRFASELTVATDDYGEQIDVSLSGAVNASTRETRSTATLDGESVRSFVSNQTAYQECQSPWSGWGVEELDDGEWMDRTPAVRQLSLLESGSLYWNGTDTVRGEQAFVITSEPTADALTTYREERSGSLFGGPSFDETRLRAWLDSDTGRPLQTELQFTVSDGGESAEATMTTTFADYNAPVSVDIPVAVHTNQHESGCPGE